MFFKTQNIKMIEILQNDNIINIDEKGLSELYQNNLLVNNSKAEHNEFNLGLYNLFIEKNYIKRFNDKLKLLEKSNLNYLVLYPKDFKEKTLDEIFSFLK